MLLARIDGHAASSVGHPSLIGPARRAVHAD